MPNISELVKNHCATCEAETERIVNNLVQELAGLKAAHEQEIERLKKANDSIQLLLQQRERSIGNLMDQLAEAQTEKEKEQQQPPQPSEAIIRLLALMKPEVERWEECIPHDPKLIELLRVFREIVPA